MRRSFSQKNDQRLSSLGTHDMHIALYNFSSYIQHTFMVIMVISITYNFLRLYFSFSIVHLLEQPFRATNIIYQLTLFDRKQFEHYNLIEHNSQTLDMFTLTLTFLHLKLMAIIQPNKTISLSFLPSIVMTTKTFMSLCQLHYIPYTQCHDNCL